MTGYTFLGERSLEKLVALLLWCTRLQAWSVLLFTFSTLSHCVSWHHLADGYFGPWCSKTRQGERALPICMSPARQVTWVFQTVINQVCRGIVFSFYLRLSAKNDLPRWHPSEQWTASRTVTVTQLNFHNTHTHTHTTVIRTCENHRLPLLHRFLISSHLWGLTSVLLNF